MTFLVVYSITKIFDSYSPSLHTCVCVYTSLNEYVVANSALHVVTVNGRDAPK